MKDTKAEGTEEVDVSGRGRETVSFRRDQKLGVCGKGSGRTPVLTLEPEEREGMRWVLKVHK